MSRDRGGKVEMEGEEEASLAKRIESCVPFSFVRIVPLLNRHAKEAVMAETMPPLPASAEAGAMVGRLERAWEAEKARRVRPSLARALGRAFFPELAWAWVWGTAWVALAIGQAAAIRPLVNALAESGEASLRRAILSGAGFIVLVALAGISLHLMFWLMMKCGWRMKTSCVALMHDKLLRCQASSVTASTGRIYSLVTSDAVRFDNLPSLYAPWFVALAMTASFVALLLDLDAPSAAAGLGVCAGSTAAQLRLGYHFERLRRRTAVATDARVRLTKEVVESSFSVKTMGWQRPFAAAIAAKRAVEAASIRRAQRSRALSIAVYYATVPLSTLAAFSVFVARSPPRSGLTVGKASSAIAILTVCRTFFYMTSRFAMNIPEIYVATKRMADFLLLPEVDRPRSAEPGALVAVRDRPPSRPPVALREPEQPSGPLVALHEASFAWPGEPNAVLRGVSLELAPGELVVVTGKVGSGKSSLLSAVLSELTTTAGSKHTAPGKIALCPQPPWNVSGSVRYNVTLGSGAAEVDADAYRAALAATALDEDVAAWESGDQTIVGEKGLTLSGGQAARLALARAVYAASLPGGPGLALLDDVLSAVDPKVARHLVDDCVLGRLCRTLRVGVILATHQRFCLKDATRVLVLGDGGRVLACAPLAEILEKGGEAAALVATADEAAPRRATPVKTAAPAKPGPTKAASQLVAKEDRVVGAVTLKTWTAFIGSGGTSLVAVVALMFLAAQVALIYSDILLLRLSGRRRSRLDSAIYYAYLGLTAAACVLGALRGVLFFAATLRAASSLHARAVRAVVHAPLSWITANPLGRILNRFSSDLAQVDDLLSVTLLEFCTLFFLLAASVVLACVALPPVVLLVLVIARLSFKVKVYVTKTMNELKRLDGITKSPFLGVFAATLHGIVPIRAFGVTRHQSAALLRHLDTNSRAFYYWLVCNRFLGCVLDALTVAFLAALVALAIAMRSLVPPELPAIALVYSLQLLANTQYCVRTFALCEQFVTSVERLLAYTRLPVESTRDEEDGPPRRPSAPTRCDDDIEAARLVPSERDAWPSAGEIELVDLEYRYRLDAPLVLKGVTCRFAAASKNGICGRTGSGKSSLLAAISRLHHVAGGRVLVDGVDLASLPLSKLRAAVTVIPQSPALFTGSVRFNVDPFGQRSDAEILAALEEARLADKLAAGLDTPVDEGGANWSTGERQLLCLARALVLRRRIVAIDEATANVDFESDERVQRTLRAADAFKRATLLVIAHRISTIIDSDQVVVLADGAVLEAGPPARLLADPDSKFAEMVAATNSAAVAPKSL